MERGIHLDIKLKGKVQGVFFRYAACRMAGELGVFGFIRNETDGTVTIEVEGRPEDVKQFAAWCHEGPTYAKVEDFESKRGELKKYEDFHIES